MHQKTPNPSSSVFVLQHGCTSSKSIESGRLARKQSTPSLFDWKLGRILGQGQFGCVVQAHHVKTRKTIACKRFATSRLLSSERRKLEILEREIQIHQSVDHPNILTFLGYVVDPEYVTIMLEYADKGDLFDYSNSTCTAGIDRVRLFHQVYPAVLAAVSYLESLQIAHRDIKPENILLKTIPSRKRANGKIDFHLRPVLCDFGWSCWYFKSGAQQSTLCGTPEYVPPELLAEEVPGRRRYAAEHVDPWALGVLALEILNGTTPFGAPTSCPPSDVRRHIYDNIRNFSGVDRNVCENLDRLATLAAVDSGSVLDPCVLRRDNGESSCLYVSLVDGFLQSTPSHRSSATQCLERYAHVLGSGGDVPTPTCPSVKQRRDIFQNHFSGHSKSIIFS